MSVKAIDLRRGMAVEFKGAVWVCVDNEKVAKGNWRSSQVVQLKNIQTGQLVKERFRTEELFEEVFMDRKEMEYLYPSGANKVFMDPSTYELVEFPEEFFADKALYLTPNLKVQIAYAAGKPVSFDLPNTVELTVVDTAPQLRGATETNQLKDAVCEGGARIKVPPFVTNGTVVKVDTRTGEYIGRV